MKNKKLLAALLCVLAFEFALREFHVERNIFQGHVPFSAEDAEKLARPRRILILGKHHGDYAAPDETFAAQLQAKLDALAPRQFGVFDPKIVSGNTRKILGELRETTARYQPEIVLLQTGEDNIRNTYGFSDFKNDLKSESNFRIGIKIKDLLLNVLYRLHLFRVGDAVMYKTWSHFAPNESRSNSAEEEAWRWVTHLSSSMSVASLTDSEADVVIGLLTDLSGRYRSLTLISHLVAEIYWRKKGRLDKAFEWLKTAADARPTSFDFLVHDTLNKMYGDAKLMPPEVAAFKTAMDKRVSAENLQALNDWFTTFTLPSGLQSDNTRGIEVLALATRAQPSFAETFLTLGAIYRSRNEFATAMRWLEAGINGNPTRGFLVSEFLNLALGSGDVRLKAKAEDDLRQLQANYPALSYVFEVKNVEGKIRAEWVLFDIEKIHRLIKRSGAELVLLTYPQFPDIRGAPWSHRLIIEYLKAHAVPVADIHLGFEKAYSKALAGGVPEAYVRQHYFDPNTVKPNGNASELMASIVASALREFGLIAP